MAKRTGRKKKSLAIELSDSVGLLSGLSPRGLALPDMLPEDKWRAIGAMLGSLGQAVPWAIGDWLNYGERVYGETYSQWAEKTGYEPNTLVNFAWVARQIEFDRRRVEKLSWNHHREVAGLTKTQQDKLLDRAEKHGWTRAELREAVRNMRPAVEDKSKGAKPACEHTYCCSKCGAELPAAS